MNVLGELVGRAVPEMVANAAVGEAARRAGQQGNLQSIEPVCTEIMFEKFKERYENKTKKQIFLELIGWASSDIRLFKRQYGRRHNKIRQGMGDIFRGGLWIDFAISTLSKVLTAGVTGSNPFTAFIPVGVIFLKLAVRIKNIHYGYKRRKSIFKIGSEKEQHKAFCELYKEAKNISIWNFFPSRQGEGQHGGSNILKNVIEKVTAVLMKKNIVDKNEIIPILSRENWINEIENYICSTVNNKPKFSYYDVIDILDYVQQQKINNSSNIRAIIRVAEKKYIDYFLYGEISNGYLNLNEKIEGKDITILEYIMYGDETTEDFANRDYDFTFWILKNKLPNVKEIYEKCYKNLDRIGCGDQMRILKTGSSTLRRLMDDTDIPDIQEKKNKFFESMKKHSDNPKNTLFNIINNDTEIHEWLEKISIYKLFYEEEINRNIEGETKEGGNSAGKKYKYSFKKNKKTKKTKKTKKSKKSKYTRRKKSKRRRKRKKRKKRKKTRRRRK